MNISKIYKTILLLSIVCLTACNNMWDLNMKPGKPVYDGTGNEALIRAQLTCAYSFFLYSQLFGEYYYGSLGAMDTDEAFRYAIATNTGIPFAHNITSADNQTATIWTLYYKVNECAADVIMMLKTVPGMSELEKDDLRGQAMVLQAFVHFMLAVDFGPVPIKDIPTYEMGMGLKAELERKPIKDVCQYALDLCREAVPMLKSIDQTKTTASITKSAAEALSYRIALYMASHPDINDTEKYNDIVRWADEFIATGPNKLNTLAVGPGVPAYARLFINNMQNNASWNTDNPEGIWDIIFFCKSTSSGTYAGITRLQTSMRLGSQMGVPCADNTATTPIGYCDLTYRALNNLYEKYIDFNHGVDYPIGDLRRDWNVPTFCYKYKTTDAMPFGMDVSQQFPYFRVIMPTAITCTKEATLIPVFDKASWADNAGKLKEIYVEDGGAGYKNGTLTTFTVTIPKLPANPTTMAYFSTYTSGGIIGYKFGSNLYTTAGIHKGYQAIQAYNDNNGITITVTDGKITNIVNSVPASGNLSKSTSFAMVTERGIGKWRREYEVNVPPIRQQYVTSCNVPVLRFADVLLMAAEAHLFATVGGDKAKGLNYLNMVRRRAYGVDVNTANPAVDFSTYNLETVMDERSRELCFEGIRRTDLVRWNAYIGSYNAVERVVAGNPNSANINSPIIKLGAEYVKYSLLPIPQAEIGKAPNTFYQNLGW
ncbi:MAG: RagB/SusD family nutrient uptake outer membrane protein [Paludibacter sp.]|nr:RagB/SusD family nutrient uptake outer membrane protein [Paludibacter sp.]